MKTIKDIGRNAEAFVEKYYFVFFGLILLIAAFNFFYKLSYERIWDWDEARYGTNAYEMIQNHDYGICTYLSQADHADLKPPLGPWAILLGYRIFGFNALGLRFYSALSCFLIIIVLIGFFARRIGKIPALIAGLILVTTEPFIYWHGARTGDYSSLLCLFFFLFLVCLHQAEEKGPYLPLAGLCFSFGFLAYSFHAVSMLIVMAAYLTLTGIHRRISVKKYVGFSLCAVLPIIGWALWRLSYPDGGEFIKAMFTYDIIARTTQQVEDHVGPASYYFSWLAQQEPFWVVYFYLIFFSCLASIKFKINFENKTITLASLGLLIPFTLYSIARTKLGWYLDPIYPSMAILGGWLTFRFLKDAHSQPLGKWIMVILLVFAVCRSERELQKRIISPPEQYSQVLLNDFKKTEYPPHSTIFITEWAQATFFVAEVVCGLNPVTSENPNDCIGKKGYLMLRKDLKNIKNIDFVKAHGLAVVLQNDDWMIVKL